MFVNDRYITYSSPAHKRKVGRAIAVGAAAFLVLFFSQFLPTTGRGKLRATILCRLLRWCFPWLP